LSNGASSPGFYDGDIRCHPPFSTACCLRPPPVPIKAWHATPRLEQNKRL
jgi:hypothetical protein